MHGKAITEPDLFLVLKMHTTELFSDSVRQVCPHLTFHFPQMINVCVQTVQCGRKIQPRKQMFISNLKWSVWFIPQSTYFPRDETGLVCLPTQLEGAYTTTLLVMVNVMRGGGRASPTLTSQG
jgi:hypothetical protein